MSELTQAVELVGNYELTIWTYTHPYDVPDEISLSKEQKEWIEQQEKEYEEQNYYSLPDYPDYYRY